MSKVLGCNNSFDSFSYQHLQGIMLFNLNKLTDELKLTHQEYHLMGVLIGFWNKQLGKAYPTIKLLARYSRMSYSTITRCLKSLTSHGLIITVKDGKNNRTSYYINSGRLLSTLHEVKREVTPCSNSMKLNRKSEQLEKHKSLSKNDDDFLKLIKKQLEEWNFSGINKILEQYNLLTIQKTIEIVKSQNPKNKGAYLRSLLIMSETNIITSKCEMEDSVINTVKNLLESKYCRHIPTGKIYQIQPDVGNHSLIRYEKDNKLLTIIEPDLTDVPDNFAKCSESEFLSQKHTIINKKPDKSDIIEDMIKQGMIEEAKTLSKLWKTMRKII